MIPKEHNTNNNPIMAYVIIDRAPCTCFGSPPDLINFIPAQINKNTATVPTNIIAARTRLLKTKGRQLSDATPFASTQLFPQFCA